MSSSVKASKRLITAIAALVASVILCIGVCLAWFASNNHVDGKDWNPSMEGEDVVSFSVTAYYLEGYGEAYSKAVSGNILDYNVDLNEDGILNGAASGNDTDNMRPFSIGGEYVSAVLFEIKYEIKDNDKQYRIFAACDEENTQPTVSSQGENQYGSALSNSVYITRASNSGNTYSHTGSGMAFVDRLDNYSKILDFVCYNEINSAESGATVSDGTFSNTRYLIMDYDKELFAYLSSRMLEVGGSLTSRLVFGGDITIGIESYDPDAPEPEVPVTGVTLNRTSASLAVNNVVALSASVSPGRATNKAISWSSSNPSVATVNENGVVAAVGIGSTVITVTTADGNFTATCNVTVSSSAVLAESITLSPATMALDVNGTTTGNITVTFTPSNATNRTITWTSSNESVALVSSGTVRAQGVGTATITATTSNGKTATCTVTVTASTVSVTGVGLNKTATTLTAGGTETLTASVSPAGASDKSVSWSSSDTSVATVSSTGVVTAVSAGTADITVTTTDGGYTATCRVTVNAAVTRYTVTFDTDGGSAVASQTVDSGSTATRPSDPTKTGFTFDDWYTTANGTTKFNFNTAITANTTVYAHWNPVASGLTPDGTYTYTVSGSAAVAGGDEGASDIFSSACSFNSDDFKFSTNDETITITVNVPANKVIDITINGRTGSGSGDSAVKCEASGAVTLLSDSNIAAMPSSNTSTTISYRATSEGTVTFTLSRNVGRTARVVSVTVKLPGDGVAEHTHTFATAWSSDATNHWHAATCEHTDEVSGLAAHTPGSWTGDATQHWKVCSVCSYQAQKANHTWDSGTVTVTPTQTTDGERTYTCTAGCGASYTEVIPATGGGSTISGSLTSGAVSSTNIRNLASVDDIIAVTASANTTVVSAYNSDYTTCWEVSSNNGTVSIKNNNSSSALTVTVYIQAKASSGSTLYEAAATFGTDSGTTSTSSVISLTTTIEAGGTATLAVNGRRIVLYKVEYASN